MGRRSALLLLAAFCACSPAGPPNVVLVIGDDHGWPDFGFMGSTQVNTPNLDRLAAQGTVFTRGYNTASICRPSLRSLLTGLHPLQLQRRVQRLVARGIPPTDAAWLRELDTLPRLLGRAGYASFQAGKFWENDYVVAGFSEGMQQPGDDPSHGGVGRYIGRRTPLDPVTDFIDAHADGPFFLWFAPMLPHLPWDAGRERVRPYLDRGYSLSAARYYANVARFDDLLGELVGYLEAKGLRRRTLIVYLADNGWDQPPDIEVPGLTGGAWGKKTLHELGLRTPLIFSWPGVIPQGRVSDALVSTLDLFPTLLDYAGLPAPAGREGRSLRGVLEHGEHWQRERVITWQQVVRTAVGPVLSRPGEHKVSEAFAVATDDWWYIWYRDLGVEELYEVREGPRPRRDVASRQPELRSSLREQIRTWQQQMSRPLPQDADQTIR